jgi:hypothetical protein
MVQFSQSYANKFTSKALEYLSLLIGLRSTQTSVFEYPPPSETSVQKFTTPRIVSNKKRSCFSEIENQGRTTLEMSGSAMPVVYVGGAIALIIVLVIFGWPKGPDRL